MIKLTMMTVWVVLPPLHCCAALWICFLFFGCYLCTFLPFIAALCQWNACYSMTLALNYPKMDKEHEGLGAGIPLLSVRVWPDETNLPDWDWVEREGIERERLVDRVREGWVSYVSLCLCPLVPAGLHYPAFSSEQLGDGCIAAKTVRGEQRGGIWEAFQTSTLGCTGTQTCQGCNDIFFFFSKSCCFLL